MPDKHRFTEASRRLCRLNGSAHHSILSDPRIARVWRRSNLREREILRAKAQPRVTWAAAAVECGGPPNEGQKLRRKVNRLVKTDSGPQSPIAEAG